MPHFIDVYLIMSWSAPLKFHNTLSQEPSCLECNAMEVAIVKNLQQVSFLPWSITKEKPWNLLSKFCTLFQFPLDNCQNF